MSILFTAAVIEAVKTGVGWGMGEHSCDYVYVVTIASTVMLTIYLACLCIMFTPIGFVGGRTVLVTGAALNLTWFIWGIVVLSDHTCNGAQPIVITVFSGLGALFLFSPIVPIP